ncbi:MAG: DUF429 domain-containing protein [Chloroflexota bacterium]|nr:DUF429 domain-containing protein [Chloroflexota bacterium]MDE2683533.1 DUF429 domain-containing protein [Chloroflexota bacterium]
MTTIIGVDFSGARADKNTWAARGLLDSDGSLVLESVQSTRREDLYRLLAEIPVPAVAALDFPFGVPAKFAAFLSPRRLPSDMPDLWKVIDSIIADEFIRERNRFVIQHGEPKRAGDQKYHPESYSPLHAVNPNMLPMTYRGIRLLRRWHEEQRYRWRVPPLPLATAADAVVTLLELMPGALLKSLGLPYKGYKRGRDSIQRRTQILDSLSSKSGIQLPNLKAVYKGCIANDDCLDSVVAAVGAAMWAQNPDRFRHPADDELSDAQLEGWIYVPKPA